MIPGVARTKNFVREHKVELAFGAGVAVTVTAIVVLKSKGIGPDLTKRLFVTSENLQKLIEHPELAIRFDMGPREKIFLINGLMPV